MEIGLLDHPIVMKLTRHLPGSVGKVEVMIERARTRSPLFHPEDASLPLDQRPVRRLCFPVVSGDTPPVLDMNYRAYLEALNEATMYRVSDGNSVR